MFSLVDWTLVDEDETVDVDDETEAGDADGFALADIAVLMSSGSGSLQILI